MPSTATYLGAGLLAGAGKGIIDYALQDALTQKQMTLQKLDQEFRAAEGEKDRAFRSEEAEKQRRHSTGLLSNTERFLDDEGLMWERTPTGTKPVMAGGKQLKGTTKTDLLKDPLVEVYDEDSPTGSKLEPTSRAVGKPSGKDAAKRLEAVGAVNDQARREARKQAEKEASEKAGWLSSDETDFKDAGGSRSAWIEDRTNQILAGRKGGGKGFNAEGPGYDQETARRAGMSRDESGHMGSVAPASPEDKQRYSLPDESYVLVKGRQHETWDKAVAAEEARGFQVIKRGDRYFSVPSGAGDGTQAASTAAPSGSGKPAGSGTKASPYRASTQAHVDWFKRSAPAGAVIEVDGKLYTKK